MKKILQFSMSLIVGILLFFLNTFNANAVQLSGTYVIDTNGTPSATVFRNFSSAITYLTSADPRNDGGPANSAPFGVSGPVTFLIANGTYQEQVIIPNIPGASDTTRITFQANGAILQAICNGTNYSVLRLQNADFISIRRLTIRTLDATFGWGIHFFQGSDNNIIDSCNIQITSVTSSSSNNSAGIVFSNSLTSPNTSGVNGYFNRITNNTIDGHPTSAGMYYGIVGFPSSSPAIISRNKFVNNVIRNFFYAGIQWGNSNGGLFKNNLITRTTKTNVTTTYGFYIQSASRLDTFDANTITGVFNAIPTNTNTFYAFWGINSSGTVTEPNIYMNNLVYGNRGNGSQFGFYFLTAFNNRFYNNTILFDNTTNSSTTSQTIGFYWSGNTNTSSTLDFRNNIISITTGGTGPKHAMFTTGTWTSGAIVNKNGYFSNAANYNAMNYLGTNYPTYNNWRTFINTIDQRSSDFNPLFTDAANADFRPREGWYAGNGDTIAVVTSYYNGVTRTLPVDIGAFQANPLMLDVAAGNLILPTTPFAAGSQPISVTIRNGGVATITSAIIDWTVNGVPQTPLTFTGSLLPGTFSAPILLGTLTVAQGLLYNISATVSAPNSSIDGNLTNNTITGQTAALLPGGTYTINAGGVGATNFTSLGAFTNIVNIGGIGGAITINYVANSGPYTEQVFFRAISGLSGINNITVNGNGEFVQFNNLDASSIGIINLLGTDYVTFNGLNVRSLNPSNGIGYLLSAGADSINILNCTIDISSVTGSLNSAGIAVTAALNSPTTNGPNVGRFNRFENNTITGSGTGGPFYAISISCHNSSSGPNNGYVVRNNIMRDFTSYGIYLYGTIGSIISGNVMSRPSRNFNTTIYGIYGIQFMSGDTIENNRIFKPFDAIQTSTSQFYGMYFIATNTPSNRPLIVKNNLIYDIKSNGAIYGFYSLVSNSIRFYHNTIEFDHIASTSTQPASHVYVSSSATGLIYRNNIFLMNRGGTGAKHLIYLTNTGTIANYLFTNNCYHLKVPAGGGTSNHIGFYNAANRTLLSDWVTATGFDSSSTNADPKFRTFLLNAPLTPGNDSLNNRAFNVNTEVQRDVAGFLRSATPDIGAYEFIVPAADAGLVKFTAPVIRSVSLFSSVNVDVQLKNFGAAPLSTVDLNWRVDTNAMTGTTWSGTLAPDDTVNTALGSFFVSVDGLYSVKAWSSNPNFITDSIRINDTINTFFCTPLSGIVTLNPTLPLSSTNVTSWQELGSLLSVCGVNGPLTVNVSSGTYNSFFNLTSIPGASSTNRITINGFDSATCVLTYNGALQRPTMLLNGAKYLEFRNIKFVTTATSTGTAVQLISNADSNTFVRCAFVAPTQTVINLNVNAFVASGSIISPTALGNSANNLLIDSCSAIGGYFGIDLYGTTSPKALNNIVRNSFVNGPSQYGIYTNFQNGVKIINNRILNVGFFANNLSTVMASISVLNSDNANEAVRNEIQNMPAGRGIEFVTNLGTNTNRQIIANNIINIGLATNITYGVFESNNAFLDLAFNAVKLNTGDQSYAGAALYTNNTSTTYSNVRIVNNIFAAPSGTLAAYAVNATNMNAATYTMNNNVYFSSGTFPFRHGGFITPTLANFSTAGNMMGPLVGNNINSQFLLPTFFSSTNLRSISPELDDSAFFLTTVTTDVDGKVRSTSTPDIGVFEFTRPAADAGVLRITSPVKPLITGLNDIVVIIKNYGVSTITTANVHYNIDTVTHVKAYTGTLAPGAIDTVRFDSTSGPSGSSQQFNFGSQFVSIKAWTSAPNSVVDSLNLNDTAFAGICGSLSGNYTINPAGSGSTNFTSIQAAVDRMNCGGVSGPVEFAISPGTYNGPFDIPYIFGASLTNTITFRSANNNAASVTLTNTSPTAATNFVLRLFGTQFVRLNRITFSTNNPSFGRLLVIAKDLNNNLNVQELNVRNCIFNGTNTTSTADALALVFGPNGDNATFLNFIGNAFTNGSHGIWIGGQNIVNQNAFGFVADSNIFENQYYSAIWLQNRFSTFIRSNVINLNPGFVGSYGIYMLGVGQESEISYNRVNNQGGYYGISIQQNAYYDAPGLHTVKNNTIWTQNTSLNYGLFVTNSNKMRIYNNTIRMASSSSAFGFYLQGHASFFTGSTSYPASYDIMFINNIVQGAQSSTGTFGIYTTNAQANTSLVNINNNLYFSASTNVMFLNGTNYTAANFYSTYRRALNPNFESRSMFGQLTFASGSSLKANETNPSVWLANGRAQHLFFVNNDIDGNQRSIDVLTGMPDIGAHQLTPNAIPDATTISGTIGTGNTQHIIQYGDTLATINWGFSGTLPSSIIARHYPGSLISHPNLFGMTNLTNKMDEFIRVNRTGGSFFDYSITYRFDSTRLGTVNSQTDLKMAHKIDTVWTNYPFTLTTVDTVANTFSVTGLAEFGDFTGTDDINPLPVQISRFEAMRRGADAELIWTTASEINASHFVIERSVNNKDWDAVGKVSSKNGNSNTTQSYIFLDVNVQQTSGASLVYYRLRAVDIDGTSEITPTRKVNFESRIGEREISVYPNPFRNQITLNINSTVDTDAMINVYDIYGKRVLQFTRSIVYGENGIIINDLNILKQGMYIVKVSIDGKEQAAKLIKE